MFYKNPISLTRKTNHQPQFSLKVIFSNLFPCLPGNKINVLLHKFPRTNSGWRSIYGKRGIKINVTFSEGSPPELCVIVPIDKRGPWLWKYFHPLYFHIYIYTLSKWQISGCLIKHLDNICFLSKTVRNYTEFTKECLFWMMDDQMEWYMGGLKSKSSLRNYISFLHRQSPIIFIIFLS